MLKLGRGDFEPYTDVQFNFELPYTVSTVRGCAGPGIIKINRVGQGGKNQIPIPPSQEPLGSLPGT